MTRDSATDIDFTTGFTSLGKKRRIGTIRRRVARNLSFIAVYTIGLYITQALASKSGTSARSGVNTFVPRMVAMMLTMVYGDQLNTKVAIDMAIMRTSLISDLLRMA